PRSTTSCAPSSVDRSATTATARPPSPSIILTVSSTSDVDRAAHTTAAPSLANARLTARPMPLLAPVTIATRPSSHPMPSNNKRSSAVLVFRRGRVLPRGLLRWCQSAPSWNFLHSHHMLLAGLLLNVEPERICLCPN